MVVVGSLALSGCLRRAALRGCEGCPLGNRGALFVFSTSPCTLREPAHFIVIHPQAWLAEFAWTEADIPRKRAERASSLPPESFEHFCIDWWVPLRTAAHCSAGTAREEEAGCSIQCSLGYSRAAGRRRCRGWRARPLYPAVPSPLLPLQRAALLL